jgi:XTP/dITP diphosphohydrolase
VVAVDRLVLVTSSPRLPAGVLSWPAWEALRSGPVHAADPAAPQALAVRAAGIPVRPLPGVTARAASDVRQVVGPPADAAPAEGRTVEGRTANGRTGDGRAGGGPAVEGGRGADRAAAAAFREAARAAGSAVWLCGPDGDPGFARAVADLVARDPGSVELEVVYGSTDPPGAKLLDVVAVMDRLRSPGGCPWDAEQTHRSLAPYLLEESFELLEAIEEDDAALLREELGDVLLQVVFHARLVEERPAGERWSIDEVAGDLVAKLVRRHPHVFAERQVAGTAEVEANWDEIKAEEKRRESVTDGVPLGQPALALAAKLRRRAEKAGLDVPTPAGDDLGARLFALVGEAVAAGENPEAALRATARAYRDAVRSVEGLPAARPAG